MDFKLRNFILDLDVIYIISNPDIAYNTFSKIICKHFVKTSNKPYKSCEDKKPWLTIGIITSIKTKNRLIRKKDSLAKLYKSKIKHYTNILRENYFKEEIQNANGNTKKQWKLLDRFLKNNNSSSLFTGDINVLNSHFANIGSKLASTIPHKNRIKEKTNINSIYLAPITEQEISNKIKLLKADKACGPDNISISLVKLLEENLCKPLAYIFNLCIENGVYPKELKKATITPIYKNKGELSDPNNYRPISLLPTFNKIFEKCLYDRLYSFVTKHGILSNSQFGFRKNLNTEDAISKLISKIDNNTVVVFLDLQKAFDTVDYSILMDKLERLGIRGIAWKLFNSFLSDRVCNTRVKNNVSRWEKITCGTPQGSCLSPLLFNLYINDIANLNLNGEIILFADDTALIVKSTTNLFSKVNTDLCNIRDWLQANKLSLNLGKTEYIDFSRNTDKNGILIHDYSCNPSVNSCSCNIIKAVDSYKYLGCIIDKNLTFQIHIDKVIKSIRSHKKTLNVAIEKSLKKSVYSACVQSHIQYAIKIWGKTDLSHLSEIHSKIIKNFQIDEVLLADKLFLYSTMQKEFKCGKDRKTFLEQNYYKIT